jgi:hypothetical protein
MMKKNTLTAAVGGAVLLAATTFGIVSTGEMGTLADPESTVISWSPPAWVGVGDNEYNDFCTVTGDANSYLYHVANPGTTGSSSCYHYYWQQALGAYHRVQFTFRIDDLPIASRTDDFVMGIAEAPSWPGDVDPDLWDFQWGIHIFSDGTVGTMALPMIGHSEEAISTDTWYDVVYTVHIDEVGYERIEINGETWYEVFEDTTRSYISDAVMLTVGYIDAPGQDNPFDTQIEIKDVTWDISDSPLPTATATPVSPTATPTSTPTAVPGSTRVPPTRCEDFFADVDTYADSDNPTTRYASSAVLTTGHYTETGTLHQAEVYLRFDLSGIAARSPISTATLKLNAESAAANATLNVYEVYSDTWETLGDAQSYTTWNGNRPPLGTVIATRAVPATVTPQVQIDALAWTQAQVNTDHTVSLGLSTEQDTVTNTIAFTAMEGDPLIGPSLYTCWGVGGTATPGPTPTLPVVPTAGPGTPTPTPVVRYTEFLTGASDPAIDWNGRTGVGNNDLLVEILVNPPSPLNGYYLQIGACTYTIADDNHSGPLKVFWWDYLDCGGQALPLDGTAYLYNPDDVLLDTRYFSTEVVGESYQSAAWTYPDGVWVHGTPAPGN